MALLIKASSSSSYLSSFSESFLSNAFFERFPLLLLLSKKKSTRIQSFGASKALVDENARARELLVERELQRELQRIPSRSSRRRSSRSTHVLYIRLVGFLMLLLLLLLTKRGRRQI
jgi:hypothetical protein